MFRMKVCGACLAQRRPDGVAIPHDYSAAGAIGLAGHSMLSGTIAAVCGSQAASARLAAHFGLSFAKFAAMHASTRPSPGAVPRQWRR